MRWAIVFVACVLFGCDDDVPVYADGTIWERPVVPLSPGAIMPRDMNSRQWSEFVSQSGIQADRSVKKFTPAWIGFSSAPSGDLSYFDFGSIVMIWNDTGGLLIGTSNSTLMAINNLPDKIRPRTSVVGVSTIVDSAGSGGAQLGGISIFAAGSLSFTRWGVSAIDSETIESRGFTASGSKGLPEGWLITYAK